MAAGTIRKRSTKAGTRWQAIVDLDPDPRTGKRRQRSKMCLTEKEAKKALAELQVAADRGLLQARSAKTVSDLCAHWLDTYARYKSPNTYAQYEYALVHHVLPRLGTVKAHALSTAQIRGWVSDSLKAGKGHRAIELALLNLRQVLAHAHGDGLIPANPALPVRVPAPAERGREMQTWTAEQAQTFLHAASDHNRYGPVWLVSLATGMRLGELLGLRWQDIDTDASLLRVRQSVGPVRGVVTIKPCLKTRSGRRDVLVAPEVLSALREHRARQLTVRMRLGEAWHEHDLVFTTDIGTPVDPSNLRHLYATIVRAAGVPRIRIHDQRHTHVTWALEEGADLKAVSERVGHSSTTITANLYQHVTRKMQDDVVTRTAGKLFGQAT